MKIGVRVVDLRLNKSFGPNCPKSSFSIALFQEHYENFYENFLPLI